MQTQLLVRKLIIMLSSFFASMIPNSFWDIKSVNVITQLASQKSNLCTPHHILFYLNLRTDILSHWLSQTQSELFSQWLYYALFSQWLYYALLKIANGVQITCIFYINRGKEIKDNITISKVNINNYTNRPFKRQYSFANHNSWGYGDLGPIRSQYWNFTSRTTQIHW